MAAYQGDTSEETRATIQKLRSDLAEAQEELEKTQYEQYIKDQKALLDDLYNEAESMLNARLDDIDGLILDLIDTVNSNAGDISQTLVREAESVGYTMTAEMSEVWQNSTENINGVVTSYGDLMASKLTSLNVVISGISAKLSRMIGESEDEADSTVSTTTSTTTPIAPPVEEVAEIEAAEEVPEAAPLLDDETKKGVAAAIWNGGYGWGTGSTRAARLTAVFGENNGIQALVSKGVGRNVKASAEYSYANMRKKFLGYKTGGLVDYTGLAWLDGTPGNPEVVLSAKDAQNFIDLRDILADISSNSAIMNGFKSLPNIPDYRNGAYGNITTSFNGGININIAKADSVDDIVYQIQHSDKIQRMLESMTVNRVVGGSKLDKYKYKM